MNYKAVVVFLGVAWEQQNPHTSHQWAFGTEVSQLMQHVYLNNELPKELTARVQTDVCFMCALLQPRTSSTHTPLHFSVPEYCRTTTPLTWQGLCSFTGHFTTTTHLRISKLES